jgi:hypothetical protein
MQIRQRKVRHFVADLWTGAVAVVLGLYELAPGIGGDILPASSEFADYVMKDCGLDVLIYGLPFYAAVASLSQAASPSMGGVFVGASLTPDTPQGSPGPNPREVRRVLPSLRARSSSARLRLERPKHSERIGRIQRDASRRMRVPLP